MKTILLLVHDDPGQEARLQAALDIARAIDGHVQCLDVALMPPAIDTPYDGVGAALLLDRERQTEAANKDQLQQRLAIEDVKWSWTDAVGTFDTALRRAAGFADLVVVNRALSAGSYPDMRATAEALVLRSRRPVVAVPDDARRFDAFGHAIIAWNGSPPSIAAMMAAVPLLRLAGKVTLLEIEGTSPDLPAEDAALYLSRHGIAARIQLHAASGGTTGESLLAAVEAHGASYVVMGAYGRRRLSEAVFGGVSRTMLHASPVPLFLAH